MFDKLIKDMDEVFQSTFAIKGVLNDRYKVDIVVDRNVVRYNDMGESIRNSYELTFFENQVTELAKGNTVDIYDTDLNHNKRYTLTTLMSGGAGIQVWAANAGT